VNGKPNFFGEQNPEGLHCFRWPWRSKCVTHSLGLSPRYSRRRWPGFQTSNSIQFLLILSNNAFYSEFVCVSFRALESPQCLRVSLARISYLVDQVIMPKQTTFSK